jgi:beta-lactamase regulating signal transducer with metallopeptidase domain
VKAFLEMLAMMAVQGALLAAAALVVTRAGRLRPAWQAAIWLVVLAKLSIPWGPALPWSLSDLVSMFTANGTQGVSVPSTVQAVSPVVHSSPWCTVLVLVWGLGAGFVLARAVVAYVRRLAVVRRAPTSTDYARFHGVPVVLGSDHEGPHVIGAIRPTIVVPPRLSGDMLRAALYHELAHVRRRDGLGRLLQVWASAVMWWFPIARLVARRLDVAREAACDAAAIEQGIDRPAYARLLVEMATLRAPAMALAMPRSLDHRIAAVLAAPVHARYGMRHKLALAVWMVVALGGSRRASAHSHPICTYTPALAAQLYVSHPEADLDGDGTLSRDEACELQAELRRHKEQLSSPPNMEPGGLRPTREPNMERGGLRPTREPNMERGGLRPTREIDSEAESLLSEPLCCNWDRGGIYSTPDNASCLNQ